MRRAVYAYDHLRKQHAVSTSCRDRKLYHPNNAALGMAAMRAGVNHWQAGLIEVGHGMVCKAYAILLVTHGPTHPITKDLEVKPPLFQHPTFRTAQPREI